MEHNESFFASTLKYKKEILNQNSEYLISLYLEQGLSVEEISKKELSLILNNESVVLILNEYILNSFFKEKKVAVKKTLHSLIKHKDSILKKIHFSSKKTHIKAREFGSTKENIEEFLKLPFIVEYIEVFKLKMQKKITKMLVSGSSFDEINSELEVENCMDFLPDSRIKKYLPFIIEELKNNKSLTQIEKTIDQKFYIDVKRTLMSSYFSKLGVNTKLFSEIKTQNFFERDKLFLIEATKEYIENYGNKKFNKNTVYKNYKIGEFREHNKKLYSSLPNEYEKNAFLVEFKSLGAWYLEEKQEFEKDLYIKLTILFCEKNGYKNLKNNSKYNSFEIGKFRLAQIKEFDKLQTDEERRAMLEEFSQISPFYLSNDLADKFANTASLKKISQKEKYKIVCEYFQINKNMIDLPKDVVYKNVDIFLYRNEKRENLKKIKNIDLREKYIQKYSFIDDFFLYTNSFIIDSTMQFIKKFGFKSLDENAIFNGVKIGAYRKKVSELVETLSFKEQDVLIKRYSIISLKYLSKDADLKYVPKKRKYENPNDEDYINETILFIKENSYEKLNSSSLSSRLPIGAFRGRKRKEFYKLYNSYLEDGELDDKELKAFEEKYSIINEDYLQTDKLKELIKKKKNLLTLKYENPTDEDYINETKDFCKINGYENLSYFSFYNHLKIGEFREKRRREYFKLYSSYLADKEKYVDELRAFEKKYAIIHKDYLIDNKFISLLEAQQLKEKNESATEEDYKSATKKFIKNVGYLSLTTNTIYNHLKIGKFREEKRKEFYNLYVDYLYRNSISKEQIEAFENEYSSFNKNYLYSKKLEDFLEKQKNRKKNELSLDEDFITETLNFIKKYSYSYLFKRSVMNGLKVGEFREKKRKEYFSLYHQCKMNPVEEVLILKENMEKKYGTIHENYLFSDALLSIISKDNKRYKIITATQEDYINETINFIKNHGYSYLDKITTFNYLKIGKFREEKRKEYYNLYYSCLLAGKLDDEELKAFEEKYSVIHEDYLSSKKLAQTIKDFKINEKKKIATQEDYIDTTINYIKVYGYINLTEKTIYKDLEIGKFRTLKRNEYYEFHKNKDEEKIAEYDNVYSQIDEKYLINIKLQKLLSDDFIPENSALFPIMFSEKNDENFIFATLNFCDKKGYDNLTDGSVSNGLKIGKYREQKRKEYVQMNYNYFYNNINFITKEELDNFKKKFDVISEYYLECKALKKLFALRGSKESISDLNKKIIESKSTNEEYIKATLDFCSIYGYKNLSSATIHNGLDIGQFREIKRKEYLSLKSNFAKELMKKNYKEISSSYLDYNRFSSI